MEFLSQPWSWWAAGILIGLTVPALLLLGNKHFGISANLRHACAAYVPANVIFFKYDCKKEASNLFFLGGIVVGAIIAGTVLADPNPIQVHPELTNDLAASGLAQADGLVPAELFSWDSLLSLRGFIIIIVGGFLVGFGTRYAGGCTSGHAIMGLSNLQLPSLVATMAFMVGGFIMTNLILPYILAL